MIPAWESNVKQAQRRRNSILDHLDHRHVSTPVVSLSALLEHPELQAGVRTGQKFFHDSFEEAPLTEEEMIKEVEMNLSRRVTERSRKLCLFEGGEPPSYLYELGYVMGTIDQGLSYAR